MTIGANSFTVAGETLSRVLTTPVWIGPAFNPAISPPPPGSQYTGIWDTGASASVITEKVIAECGLKPIGLARAHGADGEYLTEVYLISLGVPNGITWNSMRVTKGKLAAGSEMLVGMDVIGQGDFAVSNYEGRTCFSFRFPSAERIDFTGKSHLPDKTPPPSG